VAGGWRSRKNACERTLVGFSPSMTLGHGEHVEPVAAEKTGSLVLWLLGRLAAGLWLDAQSGHLPRSLRGRRGGWLEGVWLDLLRWAAFVLVLGSGIIFLVAGLVLARWFCLALAHTGKLALLGGCGNDFGIGTDVADGCLEVVGRF